MLTMENTVELPICISRFFKTLYELYLNDKLAATF